ncbi:MAG: helix-turn-helix domain-containing protein, partial [Isosphaeraceae bacterium]
MPISLKDFLEELPEGERAAIKARADEMAAEELGLAQLRALLRRSQVGMAREMGVRQSEVSKIERRSDMLVSTLRKYVEAAGGTLELVVRLPDHPTLRLNFGGKAARSRPRATSAPVNSRRPARPRRPHP